MTLSVLFSERNALCFSFSFRSMAIRVAVSSVATSPSLMFVYVMWLGALKRLFVSSSCPFSPYVLILLSMVVYPSC